MRQKIIIQSIAEILAVLKPLKLRQIVFAHCQLGGIVENSRRILIYGLAEERLKLLLDTWISSDHEDNITSSLSQHYHVFNGGSDAMFATLPRVVWAFDQNIFAVWHKKKLSCKVDKSKAVLYKRLFRQQSIIECQHIQAIHCAISDGWFKRSLHLITGEKSIEVVCIREYAVALDATYDALDLWSDSSWLVVLGQKLSDFLSVPLSVDKDLQ